MAATGATAPVGRQPAGSSDSSEIILRVAHTSDAKQVASSISFALQDSKPVKLRAVGAGAVNQMVKACAIARTYVAARGVDLWFRPGFEKVMMPNLDDRDGPDVEQTAMILMLRVI